MIRKIITTGGTLAVSIPKKLARKKKLTAGDFVKIPEFERMEKIK